jgi:hypothetical protein
MGICTYDDTMEDDEEEEAEYSAIPHFIAEEFDLWMNE